MDNMSEPQEFDLDDILKEFHDLPDEDTKDTESDAELSALLEDEASSPEPAAEQAQAAAGEAENEEASEPSAASDDATVRFAPASEHLPEDPEAALSPDEDTKAIDDLIAEALAAENEEAGDASSPEFHAEDFTPPIRFDPRQRLRELKKKLVAGPEKRYYELAELGIGKLQAAVLLNVIIVLVCAGITTLLALDMVPENRMRLVIFSQVLAMLVSALLGSHQMLDGLSELAKGRFTVNTLLNLTFAACCVDAVFCLMEVRVPCCAAFSLEMTMALIARCQRRSTEMGQMDTLRKAVRLNGIAAAPGYFEGKTGLVRTEAEVEDFMGTYNVPSAPEKVQSVYAFFSLIACLGIAVFAGLRHGVSLGVQILATSLLVAVPASFFISFTRPMAVLEKRLHMVGTVLCGWQGVKGLSGKAAFPLWDEDLFPLGSTKLNGVKFYGKRDPDEVVSLTASLITAAGGGLVPVFQQLLKSRSGEEHPVKNFQNYGTGGIGGEVCDEPVLLGSLNFLQDMGVVIPEGTMVNQAVYAAIDGQLCAVFAISYAKMRSAAAGLVTLCGHRKVTPVVLCGDFMLTESFLQTKFGIKSRRVAFPTREARAELLRRQPAPDAPTLAITTREDLVSAAYAVTGSCSLRAATRLGTAIHLIGGILGLLIMLTLGYLGSTELLTPTNVLLYQLIWMIPGFLVTEWTRAV
ncbi:MAG: hypothetical protein ACI3V5_00870 [Faecousia sp.]